MTSTSVLALAGGHGEQQWALWNYANGTLLSQGVSCPIDTCAGRFLGGLGANAGLAGSIAVVPYTAPVSPGPVGFQIISTTDGSILATVTPSPGVLWWQVASDGSYVCGATGSGNLTIWSPSGAVITSRTGNYGTGIAAYCAPGQVQVAKGPAGSNVIETITVPSGASSISPAFAGTFNGWFTDGSAFLSNVSTDTWVYSPTATQLDTKVLPTSAVQLGGFGPWFWSYDGTNLDIYKVGASATAAATYPVGMPSPYAAIAPSGPTIAIVSPTFSIIDLSQATPVQTSYAVPANTTVYAAASASQWVVGNGATGVVLDGASLATTLRYLNYGYAESIAGSQTRFAVATSIGQVLIYSTSDLSLESTLDIQASQLALSDDGSVLALVTQSGAGSEAETISLPAGTTIATFPGVTTVTLSSSGALLGQAFGTEGSRSPPAPAARCCGHPRRWACRSCRSMTRTSPLPTAPIRTSSRTTSSPRLSRASRSAGCRATICSLGPEVPRQSTTRAASNRAVRR